MNFSEAVRLAKPSDYIVGNQRRMFKIDGDVLKAANAVEYKKNGTNPEKFELATPNLSELVDLSWEVVPLNSERVNKLYNCYDEELCAYNKKVNYIKMLEIKLDEKRDIDNKRLLINALNDAKVIVRNLEIIDTLLEEE